MRGHFGYEVDLPGAGTIRGHYTADCGTIDTIELPDGEDVVMNDRGVATHRDPICRALAEGVFRQLMDCPNVRHEQLQSTMPNEHWPGYAPVRI
jgi:hypothetical protein